jgi:hypothetical protein
MLPTSLPRDADTVDVNEDSSCRERGNDASSFRLGTPFSSGPQGGSLLSPGGPGKLRSSKLSRVERRSPRDGDPTAESVPLRGSKVRKGRPRAGDSA